MLFGGFNHTKIPMARLILRAPATAAFALLAIATAWKGPSNALAQEGERPGLFDRIFGGSERFSGAGEPPTGAPGGRGVGTPLDLATMPPSGALAATQPPSPTPRDEFDLAYGYVLRRDYALAEDSFRNFLSKYPNDRLVGDATFWF